MNIKEAISKRLPLKVYLKDEDKWNYLGIWNYVENKYQGQFGYLDLDKIMLCAMGDASMNHIKLELGE